MNKTISVALAAVVVSVGLSSFIQWTIINPVWTGRRDSTGTSVSRFDMTNAMRSMMGVDEAIKLPLKTPADRLAKLAADDVDGLKIFALTAEPIRWEYEKGKYVTAWGI